MRAQTVIVCIFLAIIFGLIIYAIALGLWWW